MCLKKNSYSDVACFHHYIYNAESHLFGVAFGRSVSCMFEQITFFSSAPKITNSDFGVITDTLF